MTRNILIPIDGSENSQRAFDFYLEHLKKDHDEILLCHVQTTPNLPTMSLSEPLHLPTAEWSKRLQEQIEKSNKLIVHYEMLCEQNKLKKKSLLMNGKPGEAIVEGAEKNNASMIVMGSRGLNAIRRTFLGSVSDYVLHHTHVPVTVVPPK